MPVMGILTQDKSKVAPYMLACIHPEGVFITGKSQRHSDKTVRHYLALQLTLEHAHDLYDYLGKIWPVGQLKSKQYYTTKTVEG
jgi:hypothetical protein